MAPPLSQPVKAIRGVRLPNHPPDTVWDVTLDDGSGDGDMGMIVTSVAPHQSDAGSEDRSCSHALLLPALAHPHIHLDKAHVHSAREYSHLMPKEGSFGEALALNTQAKEGFTQTDLIQRGEWLLAESLASGVTAMRAFVEVDHTVTFDCLNAGIDLKRRWQEACHVQLVSFAQDPIFSGAHGDHNRRLMNEAIRFDQVDVIGTTPYVELTLEASKKNIEWAIDKALDLGKHVDFHLDYNLDPKQDAMVWYVVELLRQKGWTTASNNKKIMLGHCTRLTLFDHAAWHKLSSEIRDNHLPVSFAALPTSDLYMAKPPSDPRNRATRAPHERCRGTLQVPSMIRDYGIDAVIGVNNIGNAFTPWGSPDPLFVACLGVGLYQAGTQLDAQLLYECVSTRVSRAIGLRSPPSINLTVAEGSGPDFLLVHNIDESGCGVFRTRNSVAEVIWDPPARLSRDVISGGRMVEKPMKDIRFASSPGTSILLKE